MSLLTDGQHGLTAHSDGPVPVQTRSERFTSFEPADFPAVTGREAAWKFSPVDQLRHLIEGELDGGRYPLEGPVSWIPRTDERIGRVGRPEERASANAWASFQEALLVEVDSAEASTVTIRRSQLDDTARAAHTVITAAPGSTGTVIFESSGAANLVENVEIVVGEGADLTVVSFQDWNDDAIQLASHFATVGRDARLKHVLVSLGGEVLRVNPSLHLDGQGSTGEMYGLYYADAHQHIEQQVYLHHVATHTTGRVNYKGALQGDGARTVWIGDVLIGPGADATDSYEQNRNLVLTEGTRADSIPNLEIETGDILGAGHASATGRFDDEQLFYLQTRGIPEEEARRLVVIGFLTEIVHKIGNADLEARLHSAIEQELAGVTP